MIICGLNKTTLLDYPGRLSAVLFLGSCNFRCAFCQNKSLVLEPESQPSIPEDEVLYFLKKRSNLLQGVCITGGEPTLSPDLPDFIAKIKAIGLPVKLDTNGYLPDVIQNLLSDKLIDMIAMDIKNSPSGYASITGLKHVDLNRIDKSVSIIMQKKIPYEFRTTVVNEYFSEQTFEAVGSWLKGADCCFLQAFQNSDTVITPGLTSPSKEDLESFRNILLKYIPSVFIRGVD